MATRSVRLGVGARRAERHRLAAAARPDGLRPDADRDRRRRRRSWPAGWRPCRRPSPATGRACWHAAGGGPGRRTCGRSTSAPSSATPTPGSAGTGFFTGLAESVNADGSRGPGADRRRSTPAPRPPTPRTPRSAASCAANSGSTRRRRMPSAANGTNWPPATSSAPSSISRRPTPGAGRNSWRSRPRCARWPNGSLPAPGRPARPPRWTPTPRTRSPGWTPCRPGCSTSPTGRSPTSAAATSRSPTRSGLWNV